MADRDELRAAANRRLRSHLRQSRQRNALTWLLGVCAVVLVLGVVMMVVIDALS
jgi:cell division septal protein FtsQ